MENTSETSNVVHGHCLCGDVKLTVTGKELTSYICHCVNCKTFFGTPFSAAAWYPSNASVFSP